jgi:uncharacterized membrane protein SirB2
MALPEPSQQLLLPFLRLVQERVLWPHVRDTFVPISLGVQLEVIGHIVPSSISNPLLIKKLGD